MIYIARRVDMHGQGACSQLWGTHIPAVEWVKNVFIQWSLAKGTPCWPLGHSQSSCVTEVTPLLSANTHTAVLRHRWFVDIGPFQNQWGSTASQIIRGHECTVDVFHSNSRWSGVLVEMKDFYYKINDVLLQWWVTFLKVWAASFHTGCTDGRGG